MADRAIRVLDVCIASSFRWVPAFVRVATHSSRRPTASQRRCTLRLLPMERSAEDTGTLLFAPDAPGSPRSQDAQATLRPGSPPALSRLQRAVAPRDARIAPGSQGRGDGARR